MEKHPYKKPPFSLDRTRRRKLTEQLASSLRAAIETGYYKAGDIVPPVRELAAEVGVSPGIAARALARIREEGLISPRPRIGCVVCAKNRPLWKGHVVLVVSTGRGNPYENAVHAVVRDQLTAAGYLVTDVTVADRPGAPHSDFALLDSVLCQRPDLVVQLQDYWNIAEGLSARGVPFVRFSIGETLPPNCVGLVKKRYDLALAPFLAHCRERKPRSVLQIAARHKLDVTHPLEEAGIPVETWKLPDALIIASGATVTAWAAEKISELLAARGRDGLPDLLFIHDDHFTTGILTVLLHAGLRVPEDVRLVTFSNSDYGPFYVKPLTRMEMNGAADGERLVDCVLAYLRTGTFPADVVLGPTYLRGESF